MINNLVLCLFDYKYIPFTRHLFILDTHLSHIMPSKRLLYPGQLPAFRFETEPKPKPTRIRPDAIRSNIAKRRMAKRAWMSTPRRRKLQQFNYEAYRAGFAKRYVSTMSSTDALAFSIYNTLMMTWKKTSETGLQTFQTPRPFMPTSITKYTTYCIISFAHLADASDMIYRTILSSLSSTSDFHV
jgi:hypothetical protein